MSIAEGQLKAGTRTLKPKLVSAIVTHLGELNPGMLGLVEDLTAVAGKQFVARSPLSRGLIKGKTTAAFRTRFKDAVLAVNARGFGGGPHCYGQPDCRVGTGPG